MQEWKDMLATISSFGKGLNHSGLGTNRSQQGLTGAGLAVEGDLLPFALRVMFRMGKAGKPESRPNTGTVTIASGVSALAAHGAVHNTTARSSSRLLRFRRITRRRASLSWKQYGKSGPENGFQNGVAARLFLVAQGIITDPPPHRMAKFRVASGRGGIHVSAETS